MVTLKVAKVGDALAVVLTDELRDALGFAEGGALYAEASSEGAVTLVGRDLSFEARRERGRGIIKRYEKTLQDLAS